MIVIPHLLTGAAIGGRTRKIWPVFILAVISHYLLDALPHWEYVPNFEAVLQPMNFLKVILDFALAVLILGFVLRFFIKKRISIKAKTTIFIGAGAALLPDFLEMAKLFLNVRILNGLSFFHHSIHCQWVISFWQGLPVLLIFSLGSVLFLIYSFYPKTKLYSLADKEILAVEEDKIR